MYKCSGPDCAPKGEAQRSDIRWTFDVSKLLFTAAGSKMEKTINIPWKVYDKTKQVVTELTGGTCAMPAEAKTVPLFVCCDPCWAKVSAGWADNGEDVYKTIPAKTSTKGVYFHASMRDFYAGGDATQDADLDKIASTIVHEMMHYLSHGSEGLQSLEADSKLHWDEGVTDLIARKTYFAAGITKTYKTAYGKVSQLFDQVTTNLQASSFPGWKLQKITGDKPAPGIANGFAALKNNKVEVKFHDQIKKDLTKWMVTWWVQGPDYVQNVFGKGGNTKASDFLKNEWVKLLFDQVNDTRLSYGTPQTYSQQ